MDSDDYYELTSQLDARAILRYLNNLGIHNISGEVLKYFITDLKKLIKYDLQQRNDSSNTKTTSFSIGPERLHSASTFSSRTRSRGALSEICCTRDCQKTKTSFNLRNIYSEPNIAAQKIDAPPSQRACSCVKLDRKPEIMSKVSKTSQSLNSNLIKIPKPQLKRKNDPVSLYHYYTSLWAKYKPNVPGENNWSELRWSIRQKMAGSISSESSKAAIINNKQVVENKNSKRQSCLSGEMDM